MLSIDNLLGRSFVSVFSFLRPSSLHLGSCTRQTDRQTNGRTDGRRPSTLYASTLWGRDIISNYMVQSVFLGVLMQYF